MSARNASLDTSDSPSPQPGKKAGKENIVAVSRSNFTDGPLPPKPKENVGKVMNVRKKKKTCRNNNGF